MKRQGFRRAKAGFTLIELVIVITIIGILAAIALPRYVAMQRDARIAKLNGARGAVGASAALVHGAFLSRSGVADATACPANFGPAPDPVNNTTNLCTESGRIAIINGYPTADLAGILSAAGLTSVFPATDAALAAEGVDYTGGGAVIGSVITIRLNASATCSFTYAPSVGGVANSAASISAVSTAGC